MFEKKKGRFCILCAGWTGPVGNVGKFPEKSVKIPIITEIFRLSKNYIYQVYMFGSQKMLRKGKKNHAENYFLKNINENIKEIIFT